MTILVALVGACRSGAERSSDLTPPSSPLESGRMHPGDEPCENQRRDELGAPTPADDVYLDDHVREWPLAAPTEEGFDAAVLEAAVQDVGLSPTVLSLLVVRRGRLVVEEYFNGAEASHAHNIFSTTKILTALAMWAAAEDGIVTGLDATLGEWVAETAASPAARITLEELLMMRSGLAAEATEPFSVEAVLETPLGAEPGSEWAYATDNSELLALGLDRRVSGGLCRYVHERVLSPMGISVDHWHETPYGNVTGGSYAFLAPRELARLGQLLLDGGQWAGEQLLPAAWIGSMAEVRSDFECERVNMATSTRLIRGGYGMHLPTAEVAGHEVWFPGGYGGQAIMVVPDLDIVVVITQEVGPVFQRRLPVLDVLEHAVLRAMASPPGLEASVCPAPAFVRLDDGVETEMPVPGGGFSDWSPDARQIAFSSSHDLNPELYLVDADGTGLRRLTTDGAVDVLPRWSPDGMTLAFSSDRAALARMPLPELDLWLLDLATGQAGPLTNGFGDVLGHSWSPDGARIVFARARTELSPYGDLWRVDVATGDATLLAEGDFAWPEWSPDGQNIAFVTERDGQPFVAYLDLDSNSYIDVAPGQFPRWSPDGRSVLVTRVGSILAVDLDDRIETVVTEGCCVSLAPDGHRLVVSRDR